MRPVRLSANMSMKTYQKGQLFMKEKLEYLSGVCTASEYRWPSHCSFSLQHLRAPGPGIAGQYTAACGLNSYYELYFDGSM